MPTILNAEAPTAGTGEAARGISFHIFAQEEIDSRGKMTPTKFLGLLLVMVYVVALKVFSLLDIGSIFEHRLLLPILNTLFAGLIPIAIGLIAGRTYMKSGSSTVLFMGCGMLSFGLCAISAGWLIRASNGANLNVTVYNAGAFLGSLFHAIGVILSLVGIGYPDEIGKRRLRVVLGYFGILMFVFCFSLAALKGWTPPFFIQGVGPTELRQAILGSAVLLYAVSSIFLMTHYFKGKTDFLYWYSLCLAMLAIGLFAFFVQKSVGSPIGWLGRSANYFGGIFALGAILGALRDARGKAAQLEQSIADLFTDRRTTLGYGVLAVLPLPIFLFLLIMMSSLDIKAVFEPPGLFAALNTLFLTILPLAMVYFAARGFLQTGLTSLLMIANGALALGLGSLLSGWVMTLEGGGTNATVTIFNCAALIRGFISLNRGNNGACRSASEERFHAQKSRCDSDLRSYGFYTLIVNKANANECGPGFLRSKRGGDLPTAAGAGQRHSHLSSFRHYPIDYVFCFKSEIFVLVLDDFVPNLHWLDLLHIA